jgi:transposase
VSDIIELKRQGLSLKRICEVTGCDPKTVRKYLQTPEQPVYGPRAPRPTALDAFKPFIQKRLDAGVWNAVVLLRELRERGYQGGYTVLTDYLRPKRVQADVVAVRRFETPPGHQAQVDWGDLGDVTFPDATTKPLSGFLLTLGYSRALFADLATDQKLPTLLRMHERAFDYLGGVPQEILYDNMKTIVIKTLTQGTDLRGEIRWNSTFHDFARYWGFAPRLCRPYRPQTKGKVESGVSYLRKSFLCGREAHGVEDLRGQLRGWIAEVAHQRVHGTTHRVVREAWEEEKPFLQQMAARVPYPLWDEVERQVSRDAYVAYNTNRYPAPWKTAGKVVWVRLLGDHLELRLDAECLVRHPLCDKKHQTLPAGELHAGMPFGGGRRRGKVKIALVEGGPVVEVRSLAVYADAAECRLQERAS